MGSSCPLKFRWLICFVPQIKAQATNGFQAFIVFYRDDPDRQNLIDWIQEQWLGCCGIEGTCSASFSFYIESMGSACFVSWSEFKILAEKSIADQSIAMCFHQSPSVLVSGPKDWDMNIYFNCSSVEVGSREACGVPFSCCKRQPNELIKNKQCGYDVRKPDYVSITPLHLAVLGYNWPLLIPDLCAAHESSSYFIQLGFFLDRSQWNILSSMVSIENVNCAYIVTKAHVSKSDNEWKKAHILVYLSVMVQTWTNTRWRCFFVRWFLQQRDKSQVIYEKGCLRAGEEWIEANLVPVAGVAVGLAVLQVRRKP